MNVIDAIQTIEAKDYILENAEQRSEISFKKSTHKFAKYLYLSVDSMRFDKDTEALKIKVINN